MNSIVLPAPIQAAAVADRPEPVVRLTDVHRRFGATPALNGVSLEVGKGEIVGLIGRSGAGKSTLIRCLNGLERADSGEIAIEGRRIDRLAEQELQPLRRRIGMIFQHFNLLSAKTVIDNIALPLKIEGVAKAERLKRARELLDIVGLSGRERSYPSQLSGGQKQRVGIARALAARPALLLSDEATSALDPETTHSILALLKDINQRLGLTILLITHEMEVVRTIADRVAVIEAGRIVEEGPVWSVFANPQSQVTASMLRSVRPQLPEAIARRLSTAGKHLLLAVDITSPDAQSVLFDLAGLGSKTVRLLHGGIDHIQGQPVGRFFISVAANDAERIQKFLTSRLARVEVLGHVADHA
ncbi:methionine ABC transporter ATP-binding protein [Rhizobium sp. LjRoot254]|uniref:methionine ABC transporter ATP-binding protein n=1 Tax=Rhizobium sp. LjRoot254 TaxID=3342297 RepID=UPI003ECF9DC1